MIGLAAACLIVAALITAFGFLVDYGIDDGHQAAEFVEPEDPPQTFDEWRMTGHQPWPASRPAAPTAGPRPTPSVIAPTSPDSMALDVEAMIARYRAEIGELVDAAEQQMGELANA